jgi:hypothetical protein
MNHSDKADAGRRAFLKKAAATTLSLTGAGLLPAEGGALVNTDGAVAAPDDETPWFKKVTRWGQTNITEKDPVTYDIEWWRNHWKKTEVQGVIINAGGIVAYYPTKIPNHYQARFLGGRDLFGDLCRAAREDGLAVFARMDSNRANAAFYKAHPDWFAIDAHKKTYRAGDLYITCINSPYYREHIPAILTEIYALYQPEGFTDNSWSGLGRDSICYCENCRRSFRDKTGLSIPLKKDWDDPAYRRWITWSYQTRLEIWDLNNQTVKAAGGRRCTWSGMNSGSVSNQCQTFRDYKEICKRADVVMLDHQARSDASGFQNLADTGKIIHSVLGWDKLIPNSMAMYQAGRPTFRVSTKPAQEAHMWMIEGFAGGIQPWWHHIAAYHEDRRMYRTAEPIFRWYKANEEFLVDREPVGTVGIVWSQENVDFFGRDDAENRVNLPWRGIVQALIRARIPYQAVHADYIDRDASKFNLLILPNYGSLSARQAESVKRFVEAGGNLFATGQTSLYDENGAIRADYALSDLFKTHYMPVSDADETFDPGRAYHTYLRLDPEIRANVYGPLTGDEPADSGERHAILDGFELTDILPFGGGLHRLKTDAGATVLMTFVPEFPIYPPETAWMREPETDLPGLIVNTLPNGSRIAFMPADIDRLFARFNLPDHGNLLGNIVRWTCRNDVPISVTGAGMIDCSVYRQKDRVIVHLVNLTNAATWRAPLDEYIPIGPVGVRVKLPENIRGEYPNLLVAGQRIPADKTGKGWSAFRLASITNHEVVVLT